MIFIISIASIIILAVVALQLVNCGMQLERRIQRQGIEDAESEGGTCD